MLKKPMNPKFLTPMLHMFNGHDLAKDPNFKYVYIVIKNFGFSLPNHSVLKNLLKLPIIQLKFRVKSAKHSSQSQNPRSFVFGKFFKFDMKLRDSIGIFQALANE
jgi:hypothetical protein